MSLEPKTSSQKGQRLRRGCLALLFAGGMVIGGTVGAVVLWGPAWAESLVKTAASRHGVELTFRELKLGFHRLELRDVDIRLEKIAAVQIHSQQLSVDLDWFRPTRAQLSGVDIQVVGSAALLAVDLSEWTGNHVQAFQSGIEARDVAVTWRSTGNPTPWLQLSQGTLVPRPEGGELRAEEGRLLGVPLGRVATSWNSTDAQVELGFGAGQAAKAPVSLVVHHAGPNPSAEVILRPTSLVRLSGPLGIDLSLPEVSVSAQAQLKLPPGMKSGSVAGHLSLALLGYVPPHPPELNGFVFGDQTRFETDFSITEDRRQVALDKTQVAAGAFVVKGKGHLESQDAYCLVHLDLHGSLPCGALANSVAESSLGRTIGGLLGQAAKEWMTGAVAVALQVDADTRDLAHAKVIRSIGVGCGLKPLSLPKGNLLGELLDALPPLPSATRGLADSPKKPAVPVAGPTVTDPSAKP